MRRRPRPAELSWAPLQKALVWCACTLLPHAASAQLPEPVGSSPAPEVAAGQVGPRLEVVYLGNEGVLIASGDRKVLVDALFGSGIAGYDVVPKAQRSELEAAAGRWSGVDLVLATHHHGDHFDPEAVARYLANEPSARFLSTPQAVERLRQVVPVGAELLDRVRSTLPAEGRVETSEEAGVEVQVLHLHHGRGSRPIVENLGFVVTLGDLRVLHFGDTEAKLEEFEPYLDLLAETDVALLPFWFLASDWRAAMVRERIRPRAIVVLHLPEAGAPAGYFGRWGSHQGLLSTISQAFPEAIVPTAAGEAWRLPADAATTEPTARPPVD